MARLLRIVLSTALVAVVAAGCGSEDASAVPIAETEGLYLDVNGLKYQIEMSRYMNPNDVEDREYFDRAAGGHRGPPTGRDLLRRLGPGREQSPRTRRCRPRRVWEIHDTQENVYRPIAVDTEINPFVFEPVDVPPKTVHPARQLGRRAGADPGLAAAVQARRRLAPEPPAGAEVLERRRQQEGTTTSTSSATRRVDDLRGGRRRRPRRRPPGRSAARRPRSAGCGTGA